MDDPRRVAGEAAMNAQADHLTDAATMLGVSDSTENTRQQAHAGLGTWSQLGILTAFWAYVTLSNVLYARSMSATLDPHGTEHLFAPWTVRILQHLFLYPVFIGCVRLSLRVGWQPVRRSLPIQLLLALAFAVVAAPLLEAAEALLGESKPVMHQGMWWSVDIPLWVASATGFLLTYGFGLALITGFVLYQRFRDSELRRAALERAWSGARLAALRMQLSPHTLFNLLHTIRGQITWDPAAAQSMIVQLGDLLRRLLDAGEQEFSQLPKELEFARLYLELQQRRFADRLTIRLTDPAQLARAWVPSLILQPLIENAVVHGLARHDGPVEIKVDVVTLDDMLVLRVVNTTAPGSIAAPGGIGLRNVRERLSVHFGDRASLTAGSITSRQWMAETRMPLLHERLHPKRPSD
jgi:Histidine kinase